MTWDDARKKYPHSWVVFEALDATTQEKQRIIPSLIVVGSFGDDQRAAWEHYKTLKRANPQREYYALHTDRAETNIGVLNNFGRRPA